jgi:hypothetical protein
LLKTIHADTPIAGIKDSFLGCERVVLPGLIARKEARLKLLETLEKCSSNLQHVPKITKNNLFTPVNVLKEIKREYNPHNAYNLSPGSRFLRSTVLFLGDTMSLGTPLEAAI